ncbi:MAG: response regulator [Treponema sp.]|nr:response regulator [Treponema sp.]
MGKTKTILIADDVESNRAILHEIFSSSYNVIEVSTGRETIEAIKNNSEICIVLLDIYMPDGNGFEVLEWMNETYGLHGDYWKKLNEGISDDDLSENVKNRIPVIFITGADAKDCATRGYELGIDDIISKPFDPLVVRQRVNNVVALYQSKNLSEERAKYYYSKFQHINDNMIDAFAGVLEARNKEAYSHIFNIKAGTRLILSAYDKVHPGKYSSSTMSKMVKAAALHDIGKIMVPEVILNKRGPLTEDEKLKMHQHCVNGCIILDSNFRFLVEDDPELYKYCREVCMYHHERWDGKGYPEHLSEGNIPFCSQIVSIADVYDALVSERCYKAAFTHERAIEMINGNECGVFNPELLTLFNELAPRFKAHYDTSII